MADKEQARLDRQLDKLEEVLPDPPSKFATIPQACAHSHGHIADLGWHLQHSSNAWRMDASTWFDAIGHRPAISSGSGEQNYSWGERTWIRFKRWRESRRAP